MVLSLPSTVSLLFGVAGAWNGAGREDAVFVFGTLLGPEATGPRPAGPVFGRGVRGVGLVFLVSWLQRACTVRVLSGGRGVWGVWYGVVV
jgi:hypothetical protein